MGFPGPDHHVAEHEWPMKAAMAPLALLAVVAGIVGVPGLTDTLEHFLEPTFEDSRLKDTHPSESSELIGLGAGGLLALCGIAAAYVFYIRRPELPKMALERLSGVHSFLVNKWYFDELFDLAIVRPTAAAGRFGRTVVESTFVQGVLVNGTVGLVRAGTTLARSIQTGELRSYAFLLVAGVGALILYFLIVSS